MEKIKKKLFFSFVVLLYLSRLMFLALNVVNNSFSNLKVLSHLEKRQESLLSL